MIWDFHPYYQNCFLQHKLVLDNVDNDMVDHDDNRKGELEVLKAVGWEVEESWLYRWTWW
jgi:hypothetical protein